jgi:hypothetical protein
MLDIPITTYSTQFCWYFLLLPLITTLRLEASEKTLLFIMPRKLVMSSLATRLLSVFLSNTTSEIRRGRGFPDDHLLLPINQTDASVEIPYACADVASDYGSVLTYHLRRRWSEAAFYAPREAGKT